MSVNSLYYYQTSSGDQPFVDWLAALQDRRARAKIEARLARMVVGNFGKMEPVGEGVFELKIDWGPGYRVYFTRIGRAIVLLLCGGDKSTQRKDIDIAKDYFTDYRTRIAKRASAQPCA